MGGQIHMTEAVVVCGKFWEVQFDILSHYHHYHSLSLSLPDPSHSMYHCNTIYINFSSHHPTTATLVGTLRSTRPLNPDDDPDDDTASYAYMRCNAMQQCILQDMLHLMVQLTHVSHTHKISCVI